MSWATKLRVMLAQPAAATTDTDAEPILNRFRGLVLASYDWAAELLRIAEQNPLSMQAVEWELASALAVTVGAGITYFPSSAGDSMFGYKDLSVGFTVTTGANADDTMLVGFEVTDDTTNPPAAGSWVTACAPGYDVSTGAPGALQWLVTSVGPALGLTKVIDWDNLTPRRWRLAVTAGGHDGVLTRLHIRKKAL